MKIMKVQLEVTPEELKDPEVQALIGRLTAAGGDERVEVAETGDGLTVNQGLPQEVWRWVDDIAGANMERRSLVKQFLRHARDLNDVEHDFGKSREAQRGRSSYVMLRYTGRTDRGALAYVFPRGPRVEFRLPPDAAEGRTFARVLPREASGERYMIGVDLASSDAVDEAVSLVRDAIDRLQEWNG